MAFTSGTHIACGYVYAPGEVALMGKIAWSETQASPGTTTNVAPDNPTTIGSHGTGKTAFEISASVDIWVAIGPTPDATAGPRVLVRGGTDRNLFCRPGDKLAWIAA
jgi:hypothetical protein